MELWEALTSAGSRAQEARSLLLCDAAASYVCGAVDVEELPGGWARPQRMQPAQVKALSSCIANHPGEFRQMAATTAGVCLRFATDATELALLVRMDGEPSRTASVLRAYDRGGRRKPHDGISCTCDGRRVGCDMPRVLARPLPWIEGSLGAGIVCFDLRDPNEDTADGVMALPGLGRRREVSVWLPCLRGCMVRELWCDGTYFEPAGEKTRLLVLGDSCGQGFCCEDPAGAWPTLLAGRLGTGLLNQSIGGQVFQASMLPELDLCLADVVVVELGAGYTRDPCPAAVLERAVGEYLLAMHTRWPETSAWLVTPTWADTTDVSGGERMLELVDACLRRIAPQINAHVVGGRTLIDPNKDFLAGGCLAPTGHEHFARRLAVKIRAKRNKSDII